MVDYTVILSTRGFKFEGILQNVDQSTFNHVENLNSANEVSFTVYKKLSENIEPLWNKLNSLKVIYIAELDQFYEVDVNFRDNQNTVCTVTGTSLCECELSQTNLYNFNINNENDANWLEAKNKDEPSYPATVFFDEENPNKSLLHRVLNKASHYKIGHVDSSLTKLQRSFSADGTSIYNFLTGECAEQFKCLFLFKIEKQEDGSYERIIEAYDLNVVCRTTNQSGDTCNYRGEYSEFYSSTTHDCRCPKCGGTTLQYFGEDTMIYVDAENLTNEVQLSTDKDSIKNCFKLEAGDDTMTAQIIGMNPSGSSYIYYFDPELKKDMSQGLQTKLNSYDEDVDYYQKEYPISFSNYTTIINNYNTIVNKYKAWYKDYTKKVRVQGTELHPIQIPVIGYSNLMNYTYETIDLALFLESGMMPNVNTPSEQIINASTEKAKLEDAWNNGDLKIAGVANVTKNTSNINAETAIKNWAKFFIKTGYVRLEINTTSFPSGTEPSTRKDAMGQTYRYKTWTGTITVINVADENDVVVTKTLTIEINDNQYDFINEKIKKELSTGDNDKNNALFDIIGYNILTSNYTIDSNKVNSFKEALTYYCLNRLVSFNDAFESAINLLIANEQTDSYLKFLYDSYNVKKGLVQNEIDVRNNELHIVTGNIVKDNNGIEEIISNGCQQVLEITQRDIQKRLNLENYLGEYYSEFCSYRREDKYSNSNYISDGLSTSEIFENAEKFMETAKTELVKAGTPQHTITTTLFNLLKIPEFYSIKNDFKLANWIRVKANDTVYRLRLISYTDNNSDETTLSVTFSDVTIAPGIVNDVQSILSSAKSMATSYGTVMQQAEKGTVANNKVSEWVNDGLNSALVQIKNNINEEFIVDNLGITGRVYDDTIQDYQDEQVRLTHNIIAFTDDRWKSVSLALGKHKYYYYDSKGVLQSDIGYGLSSKFVQSGYVFGSQFIGGSIYSENYIKDTKGTYFNLNKGDFELAGGKIKYNSETNKMTMRNVTIEWASSNSPKITDINGLESQLEGINNDLNQLDGRIQTYSQINDPSANWTTTTDKSKHTGDLWYNPNTSITQRWNGTKWDKTTDSDLTILAQSKAQIFTTTPTIPYYKGDLWIQGSSGDIMNCTNTRASGSYVASDWVKSSKYTDDSAVTSLDDKVVKILAGTYKTTIGEDYVISPHIAGGDININNRFKVDSQGNVTLPDNATISWSNVTNQPTILTENNVTTITKNTVTTEYVNALKVTAQSVAAENITGTTISGKTFSGGNILISKGSGSNTKAFSVDSTGRTIITNGAEGLTITYGGLENTTYAKLLNTGLFFHDTRGQYVKQCIALGNETTNWYMAGALRGTDTSLSNLSGRFVGILSNSNALINYIHGSTVFFDSVRIQGTLQLYKNNVWYTIDPTVQLSDYRLKENIKDANNLDALSYFRKLDFKSFNWKHDGSYESLGLIAQEVEKIIPNSVIKSKQPEDSEYDYIYTMNQYTLLVNSMKAIKDLIKKVDDIEKWKNELTIN